MQTRQIKLMRQNSVGLERFRMKDVISASLSLPGCCEGHGEFFTLFAVSAVELILAGIVKPHFSTKEEGNPAIVEEAQRKLKDLQQTWRGFERPKAVSENEVTA